MPVPNGTPSAPLYDNVRLGGPDGLRYPLEVQNATFAVHKEVDLNLANLASPYMLTADQAGASYFTFTGASAAFTIQFPANSQSKQFLVANHSGQSVTVNMPGTTGVTVATAFRQQLCIDRMVADVRPAAAAIAY